MNKTNKQELTAPVKKEFHIPITSSDKTAVDYLAESTGISKQKLKQYMQKGCVWLERKATSVDAEIPQIEDTEVSQIKDAEASQIENAETSQIKDAEAPQVDKAVLEKGRKQGYIQRLRRAKKVLDENDILHFYYDESVLLSEVISATLVEDCGDYSVWDKPSGMLSQGSKWGDHCTVYRWAEKNLQPERAAYIVHRLDRAANGLIIVAHKKSVASQFSRLFESRDIEKRYVVEVQGDFSNKISDKSEKLTINDELDGKSAISHVNFISYDASKKTSIIEVDIETGRKHQIRKHLSLAGFPVIGDRLYGAKPAEKSEGDNGSEDLDLQLQAKMLKFICPVTSEQKTFVL